MLRISFLCLMLGTLAQVVPSCPSNDTPVEVERGRIDTAARSSALASTTVGTRVELTASAAGDAISFAWLQTAGPGVEIRDANSATATFVAPSLGERKTLRFQVTTRNAAGDVGSAEVKVIVEADPNYGSGLPFNPGSPSGTTLIARAGADRSEEEGQSVQLSALNSAGPIVSYQWRQVSGPTVVLATPREATTTFTAPDFVSGGANRLEFELTITDASGRSSRDRMIITLTRSQNTNGNSNGDNDPMPRIRVNTTSGSFVITLNRTAAPKTVANMLAYVDDGFFNNLLVHRVVPGFVVQAGGFAAGLIERQPTRDPVQSESTNGLSNRRGTVSMALRGGDPNSGTTQFFVNLTDNTFLDTQNFTVFGEVTEGMTVVDTISTVPTTSRNGLDDVPVDDILIRNIERLP